MDDITRKQRIVELESQYRRTETALAVATAEHERSFTELWQYVNEGGQEPRAVLAFSPHLTMH